MDSTPLFSVVIPAHNQKERLEATLDSISHCNFDMQQVEVIVVDDGSTDGTYENFVNRSFPFAFRIEQAQYSSQSLTTNKAIGLASGTYVLSSAHDILFDPEIFNKHLEWHRKVVDEELVVLGYLPYPDKLDVTPFMFYLVNGGYQFAYFLIRDPRHVPPSFLYAPNFSIKRELLNRIGRFDGRFPYGSQDSDLGIRLTKAGVRIVYEPEAIGYHNHPVDVDSYCDRQETIGRSLLQLERKHPDYEGGPGIHDTVITQYLMCSQVRLDHARETIRELEPLLANGGHTSYKALWSRSYCRFNQATFDVTPAENRTLSIVKQLFDAYSILLGYCLTKGYFEEALRVEGKQAVERWVRARTHKGQASIQVRRAMSRRLESYGITWGGFDARDYRISQVVPDLASYSAAARYLEAFQDPPAGKCNYQLILVVDEQSFDAQERSHLEELVEIVVDSDRDRGVLSALALCQAESVMITSSTVEPPHAENELLMDKLFERIPELTILSGALEGASGRRVYGHQASGAPLITDPKTQDQMVAVDAPIRELCCLRGSALEQLLADLPDVPSHMWNQELGARLRRSGKTVWHVPELRVRARVGELPISMERGA